MLVNIDTANDVAVAGIERNGSGFQQQDINPGGRKLARDHAAARTRPDNTDRSRQCLEVADIIQV